MAKLAHVTAAPSNSSTINAAVAVQSPWTPVRAVISQVICIPILPIFFLFLGVAGL